MMFSKIIIKIQREFESKLKKVHEKRFSVISGIPLAANPLDVSFEEDAFAGSTGIPDFWLTVLKNAKEIQNWICEWDVPILKHLIDIRATKILRTNTDLLFNLEFHFRENDYFTDQILTKTFIMGRYFHASGCGEQVIFTTKSPPINWNEGMDPFDMHEKSFFQYFAVDTVHEYEWSKNFEIGRFMLERMIPGAVRFYLAGYGIFNLEDPIDFSALPGEFQDQIEELLQLYQESQNLEKESDVQFQESLLEKEPIFDDFHSARFDMICGLTDTPLIQALNQLEDDPGIPEFWLKVLEQTEDFSVHITDFDRLALKHLTDIRTVNFQKTRSEFSFTLEFHFSTNEFFSNSVLTKKFQKKWQDDPFGYEKTFQHNAEGCKIDWIQEPDNDSFFLFFDTSLVLSDFHAWWDFERGNFLMERVIPKAMHFYMMQFSLNSTASHFALLPLFSDPLHGVFTTFPAWYYHNWCPMIQKLPDGAVPLDPVVGDGQDI